MESVGSTHKKQHDEDDIIKKLPESVISHILSFLPTKDAVRTSVLSKRWIDKWTLITKVKLNDGLFYSPKRKKSGGKQQFIMFLNRVLFLTSYSLESFTFTINNKYDLTLLNTWISCIMKKSVKKIRISTNFEFPFFALTSHYLFSHSSSLEKLVLEMCCSAIKVPTIKSKFHFKSLKHLKLWEIIFNIDNSLGLNLNLPLLQTFETQSCTWLCANNEGVTIEAPLLETVYIFQDHTCVSREPHSCTIKFSATCLADFTYCSYGGISQPIVLSNPSAARIASANINLNRYQGGYVHETGSRVCLLLKQFSQVLYMKFHGSEVLMQQNVTTLPLFVMLSYLKLHLVTGEVLISLLQKSPVLKTLVIERLIYGFDQETVICSVVPDCLTTTLELVKFNNIDASEAEDVLYLAKFFMENAMVLERMSFSWYQVKSKEIKKFKEKVFSFKKGVSSIILEFSHD